MSLSESEELELLELENENALASKKVEPKKTFIENMLDKIPKPLSKERQHELGIPQTPQERLAYTGKMAAFGLPLLAKTPAGMIPAALASGGLSALSTGIEGLSEGKSVKDIIPSALKSGAIGLAASPVIGGVGKILGAAAKRIIKNNLNNTFSEPIVEKVLGNINLTKPTKTAYEQIQKKTQKSVTGLLDDYGQSVGKAKKAAIETGAEINPMNTKYAIQSMAVRKKIPVGIPVKGKESTEGGIETLTDVLDELGSSAKMNIEDATTALNNIDSKLSSVYLKQATAGAKLTEPERLALQARGKLNSQINNVVGKGLGESKSKYASLKGLMGENRQELAKKLTNPDNTYQILNQAMKESDVPMLRRLEEIDNMLPEKDKFLDESINKIVSNKLSTKAEFEPEKGFYNVINYPLRKIAPISAYGLRNAKQASRLGQVGAREIGILGGK